MTATSLLQLERAQAFISALSNFDGDTITPILSPEFTHRIFPLSLGGNGKAVRNKDEFLDLLRSVSSMITSLNFQTPLDIIQAQDVVIFHLLADGKTKNGKEYKNEYMFTIRFDGEQIHDVREFMDSQYVTAALAELA
ncbi:hypothetical protein B0H17DRAFT_1339441 [Mycena rosella]|uniref:SnoaL-like domain-containing protein n=1 Tax=Mycena rosella TaxID=1033263 RepID=A0AAD7C3A9_MYCRO|nr:hypothetical protein B0H17DRAFT_1339441 [Mycena rosella]